MQKCAYVQINACSCKLLVYAAYCAVHISLQGCVSDEQPKRLAYVILLRWLAKEYCLLEWGTGVSNAIKGVITFYLCVRAETWQGVSLAEKAYRARR